MATTTTPPSHDDLREMLGAYALDALLPSERVALKAHLATCPTCRAELAELRRAVEALPYLVDERRPPTALRDRVGVAVAAEPRAVPEVATPGGEPVSLAEARRRRQPVWWALATAALLLVSLGLAGWNVALQRQMNAMTPRTVALTATDAGQGARGAVTVMPKEQVVLLNVSDLPPLPANMVYEVWMIHPDGTPVPGGVFTGQTVRHAMAADPASVATVAITAEPGPSGLPAPSGKVMVAASL